MIWCVARGSNPDTPGQEPGTLPLEFATLHSRMRLGVTGRSRTGTGGVTSRSSALELRPLPSARSSPQGDPPRLGPTLEHFALVRVGQPVGQAAHLDRTVLSIYFDRQESVDVVLRAPPE